MKNSWIRFVLYTLVGVGFLVGMLLVMGVRIDRSASPLLRGEVESSETSAPALSQADVTALASTLDQLEPALAQYPQLASQVQAAAAEFARIEAEQLPSPSQVSEQAGADATSLATRLEEQANQALSVANISADEQQFLATTSLFARLVGRSVDQNVTCQRPESALELSRSFEGKRTSSPQLVRDLDAARQWLEVDAAGMEGDARKAALARIDAVDRAIEYLLAAGAPDARYAFAPLPTDGKNTQHALSLIAQSITRQWQTGGADSLAFACALATNEDVASVELFAPVGGAQ